MNKDTVIIDVEVYPNYCLIVIKNAVTNNYLMLDSTSKFESFDIGRLDHILSKSNIVGYNILHYDMFILEAVLENKSVEQIYNISKEIIADKSTKRSHSININKYVIIDLFTILGNKTSLKTSATRIHSDNLVNLPYDPKLPIYDNQISYIKEYCVNDVEVTHELFNTLADAIELRSELTTKYGNGVLSSSDAQIAELIISSNLPSNNQIANISTWKYKAPEYIKFNNEDFNTYLQDTQDALFEFNHTVSKIDIPDKLKVKITGLTNTYTFGIGGLHSNESDVAFSEIDGYNIIDADVTSYYPNIIINNGLYPRKLGPEFLSTYKQIIDDRIKAKRDGNTNRSNILKIVINGTYGKFGNRYSVMYSPENMLYVTLTGQLTLLMLVDMMEYAGIKVISANTDGITCAVLDEQKKLYNLTVKNWQDITNYNLEFTKYKQVVIISVNNYFAIKHDDSIKSKGDFATGGLSKNPKNSIVYQAVIDYYSKDMSVKDTILSSDNICDFICSRRVTGGALYKNANIGKIVRWIKSYKGHTITSADSGNIVANSDSAYVIGKISDNLDWKTHINYDYYIQEAQDIINKINQTEKQEELF